MAAPAFRLPALDQDFLLGDSTRGIRFHLEYQKAEEHLRAWGVESTLVVFGSARVREGDGSGWYEAAREFARICSAQLSFFSFPALTAAYTMNPYNIGTIIHPLRMPRLVWR